MRLRLQPRTPSRMTLQLRPILLYRMLYVPSFSLTALYTLVLRLRDFDLGHEGGVEHLVDVVFDTVAVTTSDSYVDSVE